MAVDYDTHIRRGHPIVFGLLIFFGIIELAISAWLVGRYNSHHNFPSTNVRDRARYLLFVSCWTITFSFFYITLFFQAAVGVLTSVLSHGIFLFVTWVFWLAGAAAITQSLGGHLSCNSFAPPYCGQLNALEAFAWIEFVIATFAFFVVLLRGISAARRGDGLRGGLVA